MAIVAHTAPGAWLTFSSASAGNIDQEIIKQKGKIPTEKAIE